MLCAVVMHLFFFPAARSSFRVATRWTMIAHHASLTSSSAANLLRSAAAAAANTLALDIVVAFAFAFAAAFAFAFAFAATAAAFMTLGAIAAKLSVDEVSNELRPRGQQTRRDREAMSNALDEQACAKEATGTRHFIE